MGHDDVKVTGEASAEVKNLFGVIGGETIAIAVHSAGRKGQSDPVCLMALNGKDQGAVTSTARSTSRRIAPSRRTPRTAPRSGRSATPR